MVRDLLNKKNHSANRQQGVSLVEVLVAVSIFGSFLVALSLSITLFVTARAEALSDTQAIYLAEEGIELLKYVRDGDWGELDSVPIDTVYYFATSSTNISLTNTPEILPDGFHRSFIVHEVYRDGDEDIVASTTAGATVATGTLSVVVRVSKEGAGTTTLWAILTNILNS